MQCLNCGGQLEWAGGGTYARCMRDLSLFSQENGQLTPVVVQPPGGGFNPEFNAIFAQNLGFGPPPPGAQPMPPPQMQGQQMGMNQPNHNVGAGQFDMGNGQQLRVKINGQTPENFAKNKVSGMIWGWIIGLAVIAFMVIGGIIFGIYLYFSVRHDVPGPVAAKQATAQQWDGKSTFECSGNDAVALVGITSSAGVKASGNCQLTLTGVNITAPAGIEASGNAKVTMAGGSVTSTTSAAVAGGNATITFAGTKVTGKTTKSANGKIIGAP